MNVTDKLCKIMNPVMQKWTLRYVLRNLTVPLIYNFINTQVYTHGATTRVLMDHVSS